MSDGVSQLLITEKAAAKALGLSESTLIQHRFRGTPLLPFVRIGTRSIRYRVSDVHAFVDHGGERPSALSAHGPTQRKERQHASTPGAKRSSAPESNCRHD